MRKQRFDPRLVIIESVVEKRKMDQILLGIMRFSPFSIIPPTPQTDHRYKRKTSGRELGTLKKAVLF
jgi:hypothetical protein